MGCGAVLFAVSLLCLTEAQGLQHVFVQHGKDLQLDVKEPVVLDTTTDLVWKFNITNVVGKIRYKADPIWFDNYEQRAELFGPNYSLLLKNVQHSDSGDYAAVLSGAKEQKLAEYKVTVQDPVSPPNLTVTSSGSDPCNITATCSTVDFNISINFRCDAKNHVKEKSSNNTKNFSSMTVYLQQGTIFCNHSNKVSWNQTKKETNLQPETKPVPNEAAIAGGSTALILIVLVPVAVLFYRKCKRGNTENTIYEVPQDILPDQTPNPTASRNDSCQSPTSTYALVEFHAAPETTKTKNTPQPETLYAQVSRPAKSTGPTTNTQN